MSAHEDGLKPLGYFGKAFKASLQTPSAKHLSVVDLALVSIKKATSCPVLANLFIAKLNKVGAK